MNPVEVLLLGPVEARDGRGEPLPVAGTRLLTVLALLALHCGEVVADDRLVDALWNEDTPSRPANALQRQVSTLRRHLGAPELVLRRGGGYVLNLEKSAIDSFRFDTLAARGHELMRRGDLRGARDAFDDALQLWRGVALADVAYEQFAQLDIIRLTEARLGVLEARIDADLALGRDASLIGELEQLVLEHPLREHLYAQLMLALSRSGRQADALQTYQSARTMLREELGLEPSSELRALEAAILRQDGVVARRPDESSARRSRTNLRTPLTSLVGRRSELDRLGPILQENRLVTLVGPGGVGKSRLALEAAREWFERGSSNVWIVELAELTDADELVSAVMTVCELQRTGHAAMDRRCLIEFLDAHPTLLVLDNCEHLVAAVARAVRDLLECCSTLRVWTTSREGLAIGGEVLWPVPPLLLPDSVALFVERARAADPTANAGTGDGAELEMTERICARLDGLPLAIELAAARLRSMPMSELSSGLRDRFRVLNRGARTAVPRQRTLRAVVDWSYDLLFEDERHVFARLAVFGGSCTLAAARAVCADAVISCDDVAELITRLAEKSLVRIEADESDGFVRCLMLQTLVDYARDRLDASGEAERMFASHAQYYADLAFRSVAALEGDRQGDWLREVSANLINLRAAFEVALESDDAETAHVIAGSLGWYWWFTGRASEGSHWFRRAIGSSDSVGGITRARTLAWAAFTSTPGFVQWIASNESLPSVPSPVRDRAIDDLEASSCEALELYQEAPGLIERAGVAIALSVSYSTRGDHEGARKLLLGVGEELRTVPATPVASAMGAYLAARCAYIDNRYVVAEHEFRTSVELFASCDAEVYHAFGLRYLGRLKLLGGDFAASITALEAALVLARDLGLPGFADALLCDLGEAFAAGGDFDRARTILQQRLHTARSAGFLPGVAESLTALALAEWRADDLELAATLAKDAFEVARTIDDHSSVGSSLAVLGLVSARRGDLEDARRWHTDGLRRAHRFAQSRGAAVALEGLAQVAVLEHDGCEAARLLGAASALRQLPGQAVGPAFAVGLRPAIADMLDAVMRVADLQDARRAFFAGAADPQRLVAQAVVEASA
jgi:predicted ATPase/DNA-binding SARP family transcriptional activator